MGEISKLRRDHWPEKAHQFQHQATGPMDGTREDELGVLLQGGVWLTGVQGRDKESRLVGRESLV